MPEDIIAATGNLVFRPERLKFGNILTVVCITLAPAHFLNKTVCAKDITVYSVLDDDIRLKRREILRAFVRIDVLDPQFDNNADRPRAAEKHARIHSLQFGENDPSIVFQRKRIQIIIIVMFVSGGLVDP